MLLDLVIAFATIRQRLTHLRGVQRVNHCDLAIIAKALASMIAVWVAIVSMDVLATVRVFVSPSLTASDAKFARKIALELCVIKNVVSWFLRFNF